MKVNKVISSLVISIGAFLLVGCGGSNEESKSNKLVIAYPGTDNIGGVAGYAQENGIIEEKLKELGYEVEFNAFSGAGPAVNEALASGDADIAIYADFPGIVNKSKGTDIQLLGITSTETNAEIIVPKNSNIKSLKDLKGKKIGFGKGTYAQKYLYEALQSVGISIDEVELIDLRSDAETSFISGQIDALCYTEHSTSKLRYNDEVQAQLLSSTRDKEEWGATTVIVGREKYVNANEEAVEALFKALLEAKDQIIANPEEYYKQQSEVYAVSEEQSIYVNNIDNGKFDYFTIGITDEGLLKIKGAKDFLLKENLIQNDFDVDEWVNSKPYENALKN